MLDEYALHARESREMEQELLAHREEREETLAEDFLFLVRESRESPEK